MLLTTVMGRPSLATRRLTTVMGWTELCGWCRAWTVLAPPRHRPSAAVEAAVAYQHRLRRPYRTRLPIRLQKEWCRRSHKAAERAEFLGPTLSAGWRQVRRALMSGQTRRADTTLALPAELGLRPPSEGHCTFRAAFVAPFGHPYAII